MRRTLVIVHRWLGLFLAVFLAVAGLTGAIISWDHELDAWLNPELYDARSGREGKARSPLELAAELEQRDSRVLVSWLPLSLEPGSTLVASTDGRLDPKTGKAFELGFDEVGVDPVTGVVQAARRWGEVSLSREHLLPFLYKLHYSMHIPDGFGLELGVLLMGIVAAVWAIDAFVALWISFPNRASWRKSFAFRVREGGYKLSFDLHRSGGVWLWSLLLMLAVTGASMNLRREVVVPLVSVFSTVTPTIFDAPAPNPPGVPIEPKVTRETVLASARREALRHGIDEPPGGIAYSSKYGAYIVGFFEGTDHHGNGGLGIPWLYFDGRDGRPIGVELPGQGSAGDVFLQSQFPLHSGRILGLPGRILISFLGLAVTALSVTGIVIWARKRRARERGATAREAAQSRVKAPLQGQESIG